MKIPFCWLTLTIALFGCDNSTGENSSYDYSIEQQLGCFCPQGGIWVKLYVRADTIADAITISDNAHLSYEQRKSYKSIKGLFEELSKIDTASYVVKITMDSTKNYPAYLYFNPKPVTRGDTTQIISDAQMSYTTKLFTKLN
jgi:hypothetical protein